MLIDGLTLVEGSSIKNLTVDVGTSFPLNPDSGELFYRSDLLALYVYNGTDWISSAAISSSDVTDALGFTPVDKNGDTMTGLLTLSGDPTNALHAVTKQYADSISSGINIHAASRTATTAALPASTYNNGTQGVGATLTANANGAIGSVGGYAVTTGDRVLVKNQADTKQNGVYTVTDVGSAGAPWVLTRATDFDGAPNTEVMSGDMTFIQSGTLEGTQWVQTTVGTGVGSGYNYVAIGTDNIVFTQFAGAGVYTAGTNIDLTNNVISVTGTVTRATNVAGGVAGGIVYQSGVGTSAITAAGTSGQVLTSNGASAPTWTTISTVPALPSTRVPYGSASNLLTSSTELTYDSTSKIFALTASSTLSFNTASAGNAQIYPNVGSTLTLSGGNGQPSLNGGSVAINAGNGWDTNTDAGSVVITAGNTSKANSTAGSVTLRGGQGGGSGGNANGGDVILRGGQRSSNGSGLAGNVIIYTHTGPNEFERFRITNTGALAIAGAANVGTAGQIFTSNGDTAPSWSSSLASSVTATTQAQDTANTTIATTAFVDRLRSMPISSTSGTAVIGDRGKVINVSAGLTVPANVFAAGDTFTIFNNTAAAITVTQGASLTLRFAGSTATGNRTLATYGFATVWFLSATVAVISGNIS